METKNDKSYYEDIVNDFLHRTQCLEDLYAGKIKISDIPFEYRNHWEYLAAHIFARTIHDDKERHDQYWKIASQLEADILQLEATNKEKADDLMCLYDTLFTLSARFFK